jgi:hypothetical protein
MMFAQKIDFKSIPVIEVARDLLGEESKERSTAHEKHFPDHAGLFVNVQKNVWRSHGNDVGGDALDLVCHIKGSAGVSWLRSQGLIRQNGQAGSSHSSPRYNARKLVATYHYTDEAGTALYHVDKYEPKDFRPWRMIEGERVNGIAAGLFERRPGSRTWWRVKDKPRVGYETREFPTVKPVPYRQPELLQSGDAPVLIPGGEKDVDNLRALGFTATTNHGGEGHWWPELTPYLKDRRVFILCDNDAQGETHQAVVGAALNGVTKEIKVVRFPELPAKGDVSDFIAKRRKDGLEDAAIKKELAERFRQSPEWKSEKPEAQNSLNSFFVPSWPELDAAALYGLAGEVVRTIEPHSEADPVAILIQFLACAGNILDRHYYYQIESDRHHANLFTVLVGDSAKSRKGTSIGRVKAVVRVADEQWFADRTKGGLSSGEGFIYEVRDQVKKWNAANQDWDVVDPGVTDKRLTIIEPEFAGALSVMERHGNILSPMIRKAWDGDKLATLTKTSPLTATNAHISIIGHITETELKARLSRTDAANGFANRFLFALVKRSKLLPFGGSLKGEQINALGAKLDEVVKKAVKAGSIEVTMTKAAAEAWDRAYEALSAPKSGLLGAITARAEAQVIRLAMIYALLDGKTQIEVDHLKAGLAVWEYCEASAARIFGGIVGDVVADDLLGALKDAGNEGLTKTQIHDHLGRNQSRERIDAALSLLVGAKMAHIEIRQSGSKSVSVWVATNVRRTNLTNNHQPEVEECNR